MTTLGVTEGKPADPTQKAEVNHSPRMDEHRKGESGTPRLWAKDVKIGLSSRVASSDPQHEGRWICNDVQKMEPNQPVETRTWTLIEGKAILVSLKWHHENQVNILVVYAPTGSGTENADFWTMLEEKFQK
ncbi:hypothetical protein FA13DRAFT_1723388 [Coprinellus micaceus]|uniref:Uncharacterized protein n=1 Tax=Coprinellus micaceus TaxID=71717 RepID=A0A4Y7R5P2_COPMI|nr:hypothetical protein FA13DRAFT_1723388 [Coprinellus micaceus]